MSLKLILKQRVKQMFRSEVSTLNELLKAQQFNSTITDSEWLKIKSFSPGGWAADYALLYTLYRVLNDTQPQRVLEFGLGQSSKLVHQYATHFSNVEAITVEHDSEWISFFKKGQVGEYELNILQMELDKVMYNQQETLSYKNVEQLADQKYNLIVVDAPYGSDHYSRSQIINIVPKALDSSFCVIIDDYNRKGEQDTAKEVIRKLLENDIKYCKSVYSGSKDHILICSEDLKFLTTM